MCAIFMFTDSFQSRPCTCSNLPNDRHADRSWNITTQHSHAVEESRILRPRILSQTCLESEGSINNELLCSLTSLCTHSLTRWLTHLLTYSLTHSLNKSLANSFTWLKLDIYLPGDTSVFGLGNYLARLVHKALSLVPTIETEVSKTKGKGLVLSSRTFFR